MQAVYAVVTTVEIRLRNRAEAAGLARQFIARQLAALNIAAEEAVVDALQLVVTEFVGNVFCHTDAETLDLKLVQTADGFRVSVSDSSDARPVPRSSDDQGESGRGLRLVEALTDDWGVEPADICGKSVWAWIKGAA